MNPTICARNLYRLLPCLCLFAMTSERATAQDAPSTANQPAPTAAEKTNAEKTKKVWTNDDVATAGAANADAKPPSGKTTARPAVGDARLGLALRAKLQKLESQMKDTEAQLNELKKFAAGETDGSSGRDVHKGVNRLSIPEQIQKLEANKSQLGAQIDAIYDEARSKGIPPGELR